MKELIVVLIALAVVACLFVWGVESIDPLNQEPASTIVAKLDSLLIAQRMTLANTDTLLMILRTASRDSIGIVKARRLLKDMANE